MVHNNEPGSNISLVYGVFIIPLYKNVLKQKFTTPSFIGLRRQSLWDVRCVTWFVNVSRYEYESYPVVDTRRKLNSN